jgi:uroporphyrinogen decarboxylase
LNPRERVLTALARRVPDRVPKTMSLCPSQLARFRQETGRDDPHAYFGMEVRTVDPLPARNPADFGRYLGEVPAGARVDDWGIAWVRGDFHFERMIQPLRAAASVQDALTYPYPNLIAEERFTGYADRIVEVHRQGYAAIANCMAVGGTVFWPAYKLRGMEAILVDLVANPDFAGTLLDIVTEMMAGLAARLARYDIDILWLADDFGTQRALMMRPKAWRGWFKERLRAVIAAAKAVRPDLLVAFHSDGKIDEIIPDLIEIGMDVLNPLQPEVMDPAAIKREFGRDLAFWGGLGTQTTLPFGSPDEVRRTVRDLIATVGADGGFLIAPTHVVEPEVPWENILAFVEAVEEFGRYEA